MNTKFKWTFDRKRNVAKCGNILVRQHPFNRTEWEIINLDVYTSFGSIEEAVLFADKKLEKLVRSYLKDGTTTF